jgi:hypothetical protein
VRREFSAGGVVIRRIRGAWHLAAIRPGGKNVWALPKGLVEKLGDVRYVYFWEGERVFKIVSFYLVRYSSGRLGDIPKEFRHEVAETRWLVLEDAPRLLAYKGEKEMAAKALQRIDQRAV